jgi:hypothetical protein
VPWAVPEYDVYCLPCFEHEIYSTKSLAACGVAPHFRGSAILMHGDGHGQLLSRFKHTTGLFLGCSWLRNALWAELAKLHGSTPNWQLYCGAIVTDKMDCTLATMHGPQRDYISSHWQEMQAQVDRLHIQCMQHGFMHLEMCSHTVGCRFSPNMRACRLYLNDFHKAIKDVCLTRLNALKPAEKGEVLAMINTLTEGVVQRALDETKKGGSWMAQLVDRWVTIT